MHLHASRGVLSELHWLAQAHFGIARLAWPSRRGPFRHGVEAAAARAAGRRRAMAKRKSLERRMLQLEVMISVPGDPAVVSGRDFLVRRAPRDRREVVPSCGDQRGTVGRPEIAGNHCLPGGWLGKWQFAFVPVIPAAGNSARRRGQWRGWKVSRRARRGDASVRA